MVNLREGTIRHNDLIFFSDIASSAVGIGLRMREAPTLALADEFARPVDVGGTKAATGERERYR
jgi:hypothetical protein